jgi:hypothetical protein
VGPETGCDGPVSRVLTKEYTSKMEP